VSVKQITLVDTRYVLWTLRKFYWV